LEIAWDPEKSDRNVRLRRFDFAFASQIFEGEHLKEVDTRREYGERRVRAIGLADGLLLTVVYTDRDSSDGGTVRRIISARRSNKREREEFRRARG